ncbi:related to Ctr copper transporter [Ramularia collo-cygni]|uniref:Copper transport protein n=1 Tax=Ramularia collo-cygni TaxID=112498 RepID=A0A2D3UZP5_9PEZI|nr:related to Ctr copper transporter [Ramularia collo-cygni]CZT20978.1 related to Ctr copper transporter [Ramularia collo-cygni]
MDHMHMASSTSSASMASATSMDMSGMDMTMDATGHMHMGMKDMMMTFFTATTTALYADSWTPATSGQYIGTCIFLIVLAAIFRGIVAVRANFNALLVRWSWKRDTSILRKDFESIGGNLRLIADKGRPWNINEALARAALDTVLAGVSYLLMLAVMTMNVGYFMSILGGTFLGSFVIGDWDPTGDHCDGH